MTESYDRRRMVAPLGVAGRGNGFTLVELMIVVAVIAILAAIAYPSYVAHIVKARRATAASCLMERGQDMERYYTTNLSYASAPDPTQCEGVTDFYTLSFNGSVSAKAYSLRAVPKGAQLARDTQCGTLYLNQKGERTVSVSGTDPMSCW
ncbi:type IV pilin protein [Xanthomonas sacchari]|uniref:type IV pilin protein n=1 Tax=Xanthomonas sacchari TaxID=56458 RepID=UPI0025CF147F|nr:type IV pilin protein [Xanthomonas sacchari]MCW0456492.1 hypothetical protein [Xanthomonas sacchari]